MRPRELVPIASFLALRGRCLSCREKIAPFYPVVETSALLAAIMAFALLEDGQAWIALAIGLWLVLLAAIDWQSFLLPDWLTLPLLALGLLLALAQPAMLAMPTPVAALIGSVGGFAFFRGVDLVYAHVRGRSGMGEGDAKLAAAAGAWLGYPNMPDFVLLAGVTGLVQAFLTGATKRPDEPIPFGPALAAAFYVVLIAREASAG